MTMTKRDYKVATITRGYESTGSDISDIFEAPDSYSRCVWRATRLSGTWEIETWPDEVRPGYVLGLLRCELAGRHVFIEEIEQATGVSRDAILAAIKPVE